MSRFGSHIRGNAIAYVALFFALGGVSYAAKDALVDKRDVIKPRHLSKHVVHRPHIDQGAVGPNKLTNRLKRKLGLGGNNQPVAGTYVGSGSTPDASNPIEIIQVWSENADTGRVGLSRMMIETVAQDREGPCNFPNAGNGGTYTEGLLNWQFLSAAPQPQYSGDSTLNVFGGFVDQKQVKLTGGLVKTPDDSTCFLPSVFLARTGS